jgi:hypothetical protein
MYVNRKKAGQGPVAPGGDQDTKNSAQRGKHDALGQELPDQLKPPRPNGEANRNLPAPSHGASQEEVGNIRARDQED